MLRLRAHPRRDHREVTRDSVGVCRDFPFLAKSSTIHWALVCNAVSLFTNSAISLLWIGRRQLSLVDRVTRLQEASWGFPFSKPSAFPDFSFCTVRTSLLYNAALKETRVSISRESLLVTGFGKYWYQCMLSRLGFLDNICAITKCFPKPKFFKTHHQ